MQLNNWNKEEVDRAETIWGGKVPPYIDDMFEFAVKGMSSWLDLGCGFGRFLNYLTDCTTDPDYIGYDSSPAMCKRIKDKFPHYSPRIFQRPITTKFSVNQDSIICSAVLIHITLKEQDQVLSAIKTANPKKATFDINSPSEQWLLSGKHFERRVKGENNVFRMTWQSHYIFTRKVIKLFTNHSITTKYYPLKFNPTRYRVCYFLERYDNTEA